MNNLFRFCVLGNAILCVDTTFEIVDGLWLTDTTYTKEALIDLKGKHPEFPGPSFWHFHKMQESYRHYVGELAIQKPELLGLEKIGRDLNKALSNHFTDVFQNAKPCTALNICRNLTHLASSQHKASWQTSTVSKVTCFFRVDLGTQRMKTIFMSNLTTSKVSGKKQPLVFVNGFEKKQAIQRVPYHVCKKTSQYRRMLLYEWLGTQAQAAEEGAKRRGDTKQSCLCK